jgi:cytochrome c peroxidase
MPIQDHGEMDEKLDRVVEKLRAHADYPALFERAFSPPGITPEKLALAIENFLLSLVSGGAKFDRYMRQQTELTPEEKRGFELFFLEFEPRTGQGGADCFHCHGGAFFTDHQFHNNGLGDEKDLGRFAITQRESDRGKFATPGLRNVARTAPYMHDGRFATLEEVIGHYNRGVKRSPTLDPNLAKHPASGLGLSDADVRALVAFLHTLTDDEVAK